MQVCDITLVGRKVTVVFNGETLIDNQEIAGVTGDALDSNEGEPGPIYFQGDPHGGIRYRKYHHRTAEEVTGHGLFATRTFGSARELSL
jgi:hypothetical protein